MGQTGEKHAARAALRLFWVGILLGAIVFIPMSLFGFDPTKVPKRLVVGLLGTGLVLLVIGLVRFVLLTRGDEAERRRAGWMVGGVLVLVVAAAGTVMVSYSSARESAVERCREAERSTSVAEQRRLLEDAASFRARVGFFNERVLACEEVERAIAALERGECPRLVPADARCRCGTQRFPEDWLGPLDAARCDALDEPDERGAARHALTSRDVD